MTEFSAPHHTAVAQLTGPGAPFEVVEHIIDGISYKAYKNAEKSLASVIAPGRQHGEKLYLQYMGEDYSFADFFAASDRFAVALKRDYGIGKGDHVAIAMRNRPEWLMAFVAIINLGAVAVPLNSWGRSEELQQGLTDGGAKLVVCDADRLRFIRSAGNNLQAVVVEPDAKDDTSELFWPLVESANVEDFQVVDVEPDDPAILLFTSGTSGRPKGAMFSQMNCAQSLMNVEFIGAATYMTNTDTMNALLANPMHPKTLFAVPLFHISGLFSQSLISLRHGRGLYMMYKWDPKEAARIVKEEGITVLMGASAMLLDLLTHDDFQDADTSNISNISAGGGATPSKLSELYSSKTASAMPGAGWGLTETGGSGAAFTGYMATARPGASGFPSPIIDFKFCDEDGAEVADGEPGEIWIKSAACIHRYYSGAKDGSDFEQGWFKTGDVGYFNEDGLLYICDRVKDMIIRGGENIYPVEVENCLIQFPGCAEAAVVAIDSDRFGEEPAAVVRFKEGHDHITEADVIRYCKEHLAAFKVPVQVVFTSEPMPRTATEKLIKAQIKRTYFA